MRQREYLLGMSVILCTILAGCLGKAPAPKPTYPPVQKPATVRKVCSTPKPAVIAVIDTGLGLNTESAKAHLCKFGHKDFTSLQTYTNFPNTINPVPTDEHGHGTNIAGLIDKYAGERNYCMVILKYYSPLSTQEDNLANTVRAIEYAMNIGVKYINYSGGGMEFSLIENRAVKKFLDKGGKFIAAAGNEGKDIDVFPFYPAKDDKRVISVGNLNINGQIAETSNYGESVTRWERGTAMTGFGVTMTGTSQATAVAAGKIINETECDK